MGRRVTTLVLAAMLGATTIAAARILPHRKPAATDGPALTLRLVEPEKKAREKTATLEVKVSGLTLVDPASTKEQPRPHQGHLHYRLDDGPVIATTTTKLSFHELQPGDHQFLVALAANDHTPLGPEQTVRVNIP